MDSFHVISSMQQPPCGAVVWHLPQSCSREANSWISMVVDLVSQIVYFLAEHHIMKGQKHQRRLKLIRISIHPSMFDSRNMDRSFLERYTPAPQNGSLSLCFRKFSVEIREKVLFTFFKKKQKNTHRCLSEHPQRTECDTWHWKSSKFHTKD